MAAMNDVLAAMSAMGMLQPLQVLIVLGVAIALYRMWVNRS